MDRKKRLGVVAITASFVALIAYGSHQAQASMPIPALKGAVHVDRTVHQLESCFSPDRDILTIDTYRLEFDGDLEEAIRAECKGDVNCHHSLDNSPQDSFIRLDSERRKTFYTISSAKPGTYRIDKHSTRTIKPNPIIRFLHAIGL